MVAVEVRDRGRGIREEERERIFELRERGDGLIEPGSGLGLYAARQAARRQGGDVVLVRSGPNQGSVFKATFPYDQA
jgi:signal transduction histidine kinase